MARQIIHKLKAISQYGGHVAMCGKSVRNNSTTKIDYEVTCISCIGQIGYIEPRRIVNQRAK